MKFIAKKLKWSDTWYHGTKNGFIFRYTNNNGYYVCVSHKTKDIRFNSLWDKIIFNTTKECEDWCETFDYTKHHCIGEDAKLCY